MSPSPLDFQMSLRQISEGVRQQEKNTKRRTIDKSAKSTEAQLKINTTDVGEVENKDQELPLDAQNPLRPRQKKSAPDKNPAALPKNPKRLSEKHKGNFLDIEVT